MRAVFEDYDAEQQREQFEQAASSLQQRFADVGVAYHSFTAQNGDPAEVTQAAKELYLALENPVIQESVCLAVADEFEPLIREWFADLQALMWGWAHVSTGID